VPRGAGPFSSLRFMDDDGIPMLEFEVTGTRMALAGGMPGPSDRVGSGGPLRSVRVTMPAAHIRPTTRTPLGNRNFRPNSRRPSWPMAESNH
jgi:hypothetical protein